MTGIYQMPIKPGLSAYEAVMIAQRRADELIVLNDAVLRIEDFEITADADTITMCVDAPEAAWNDPAHAATIRALARMSLADATG